MIDGTGILDWLAVETLVGIQGLVAVEMKGFAVGT